MMLTGKTSFPDVRDAAFTDFLNEIALADSKILNPLLVSNLAPSTLKGFIANCLSQCTGVRERPANAEFQRKTEIILYQTLVYLQATASFCFEFALFWLPSS